MENGTVIWKEYGIVYKAQLLYKCDLDKIGFGSLCFKKLAIEQESQHPEPFNDGEYLHYTRFHTQLKDMIGTDGFFYDDNEIFMGFGKLSGLNKDGCPCNENRAFCYFAVPIKKPKIETQTVPDRLRELADEIEGGIYAMD